MGIDLDGGRGGGVLPVATTTAIARSYLLVKRREQGAWACWECDDESEEGLRSIGRRVGEEDGGPGPPVLAEEEGRIANVDV